MSTVAGTGTVRKFPSVIAWSQAAGLQAQEFGPIAAYLTTSASTTLTGMVNVNTAPSQVLLCLPGIQQGDADTIVASRPSSSGGINTAGGTGLTASSNSSNNTSPNATTPNTDLTWLFQAVQPQTAASIGPYITTRSFQYSADIVAVSGDGRSFRRVRIVINAHSSPPAIVYRKDLTAYGWPLPPDIRTLIARARRHRSSKRPAPERPARVSGDVIVSSLTAVASDALLRFDMEEMLPGATLRVEGAKETC